MQYRKYLPVSGLAVIAVSVLLFSCLAGLMLGYIPLSFPEVLGALAGGNGAASDIVRDLRLPRIILSAAAGMGLALSGVVMQAMFRNPMASPYIMGISSGASLGAVAAVFLGIGSAWGAGGVGLGAFAGALLMSVILAGVIGKKSGTSYSYRRSGAWRCLQRDYGRDYLFGRGVFRHRCDAVLDDGKCCFCQDGSRRFSFNDCHCRIRFFPPAVADTESDASRKGRDIALGQGPDDLLSAVYISQCTFGGMYRDGGGAHRLCRAGGSLFREILYRGRS